MVTFVGLAPDSTLRFGADTTQRNLAGCVFDFKDSVFVEAAMAYFFSYRQQAGASSRDLMNRDLGHMLGQNLVGLCREMVENEG